MNLDPLPWTCECCCMGSTAPHRAATNKYGEETCQWFPRLGYEQDQSKYPT